VVSGPGAGIRVVVADDDVPIRKAIRAALEDDGCEVCAECATAAEAARAVREQTPDVALLDIHMPGNGVHAADQIARESPKTAIVMLTQSRDDDDLFKALRAGASGYLLKDADPATLASSLRGVLDGEAAMPPRLVARVLEEFRPTSRRRPFGRRSVAASKLSSRELEVIELLGDGLSTSDVARALFLSPTTVRVHVNSVLRKLRAKDRAEAIEILRDDERRR
jgi:DNA-binding NarL/FixJ family response regulator